MTQIFRGVIVFSIVVVSLTAAAAQDRIRDFDTMGDVNCEDEYARLDNFAVELNRVPPARGVIIYYGGLRFRGKLPRRNEAAMRAARIKPYLVDRRGIPADRVVVINGGYRADWEAEFWAVLPGDVTPVPQPLFKEKEIKFRKGKANARDFRCRI